MFAGLLLFIVLASASADDHPVGSGLIGRLAAPSFDDRVAAYKAIERLGEAAVPALRAAANSSDPRIRSRARALIESIGRTNDSDRFTQPTLIALDFHNRPLSEVIDTLNDRHNLRLALRLDPLPRRGMGFMFGGPNQDKRLNELKARPITLESPRPLPFWEAIDRLCKAGALRYSAPFLRQFGTSPGSFYLIADRTGRGPVADFGPFRVQMTAISSEFDRDFVGVPDQPARPAKPPGAGSVVISLFAQAEPGLKLELNGAAMVLEATDDRGRSLVPAGRAQVDPHRPSPGVRLNGGPPLTRIELVAPDPPGKLIRRLTGKIPVIAVAKASNPVVIALAGKAAVGKQISTGDMTLVVDDISVTAQNRHSVRVTVRPNRGGLAPHLTNGQRGPVRANFNRGDALERLELYDTHGKRVNSILGEQTTGGDGQGLFSRYRLVAAPEFENGVANGPGAARIPVPTELRYSELVQTTTEIPFDFHDIPMP